MTSAEFDRELLESEVPLLVVFWAGWCAPCRALAPTVDALALAQGERLKVAKIDVDDHSELVERFDAKSIPTLLLFRNGTLADRLTGAVPYEELEAFLSRP